MTETWRHPQERDADVILYSSAFRRLRGVTQVTPITDPVHRAHDRLTHSLKVAQVGARNAQYLQWKFRLSEAQICPQAVYAAGLAHDLGHPPFGHIAEAELQRVLTRVDGYKWALTDSFEGNAQSFRIVTRLAQKSLRGSEARRRAMDLTPKTLAALAKYPWGHLQAKDVLGDEYTEKSSYYDKKWGYYDSDQESWEAVKNSELEGVVYSPNARLMDISDDVTYAVHDVADYYRMGMIPLHLLGSAYHASKDLRHQTDEFQLFDQYAWNAIKIDYGERVAGLRDEVEEWLRSVEFPFLSFDDSTQQRSRLHAFESTTVCRVQESLDWNDGYPCLPEHVAVALAYLKELTWFYVINHPHLSATQAGQRRIIRELHEWMCEWVQEARNNTGHYKGLKDKRDMRRLPRRLSDLLVDSEETTDAVVSRAVVDVIASLTDAEAVSLHHQMGGITTQFNEVAWL